MIFSNHILTFRNLSFISIQFSLSYVYLLLVSLSFIRSFASLLYSVVSSSSSHRRSSSFTTTSDAALDAFRDASLYSVSTSSCWGSSLKRVASWRGKAEFWIAMVSIGASEARVMFDGLVMSCCFII
uniref:Uncharacterized protein n=1 Tax=Kalanchoe fedtschenkoi TaxID=63787 RepID=A0A7N0TBH6_KALFE